MASSAVTVTAADRLTFTVFLALAFHGIILFGVSFAPERPRAAPHTLDVTLAQHLSDEAPDEADFIAQSNQLGAGDQDEKKELSATELADFADNQEKEVQLQERTSTAPRQRVNQQLVITTASDSDRQIDDQAKEQSKPQQDKVAEQDNPFDLSRDIASLQARLDRQQQAYAKRPRVRRLTSVSARAHYEAAYIDAFRRKVETMGTRNFPTQALQNNTFGAVRMMVALNRDGAIKEIRLLQSSGHPFLDEAAMQSVRLAAPFAPFTTEMRQNMDVLEIIRTWTFDADRRVTSG